MGDTYAYDAEGAKTKRAREVAATGPGSLVCFRKIRVVISENCGMSLKHMKVMMPSFAHLLDNFQPLLLNHESNGKSWTEHHVKKSQIYKRNEKIKETSPEVWEWMKQIVEEHIVLGHVIDE